jgi:hypothetical protein
MARFFFDHVMADGQVIADEDGEEFPIAQDARNHALQVVAELSRNQRSGTLGRSGFLAVIDENGVEVFRVPL